MAKSDGSKISAASIPSYSYRKPLHEKPAFNYAVLALAMLSIVMSSFALINSSKLHKSITGNAVASDTISVEDFLKKLTSHDEMKSYIGIAPLNIIQVTNNNLASLQTQISGLDISYIGNFIVQYNDRIVFYDYNNDKLRGTVSLQQQQPQLPADFFTKLNKHAELKGLENQKPIGGQLDLNSLSTLKQQFPDVYKDAKVGDFLLRYQTKLIIYDYNADKIVNSVNLG